MSGSVSSRRTVMTLLSVITGAVIVGGQGWASPASYSTFTASEFQSCGFQGQPVVNADCQSSAAANKQGPYSLEGSIASLDGLPGSGNATAATVFEVSHHLDSTVDGQIEILVDLTVIKGKASYSGQLPAGTTPGGSASVQYNVDLRYSPDVQGTTSSSSWGGDRAGALVSTFSGPMEVKSFSKTLKLYMGTASSSMKPGTIFLRLSLVGSAILGVPANGNGAGDVGTAAFDIKGSLSSVRFGA